MINLTKPNSNGKCGCYALSNSSLVEGFMNDNNETIISEFGFRSISPLPSEQELAAYYQSDYCQNPHGTYQETYTPQEVQAREANFVLSWSL